MDAGIAAFQLVREEQADIAAADDDDPTGFLFFVSENGESPSDVIVLDAEIDVVADEELIVSARNQQVSVSHDPHDDRIQIGEKFGQLPQGCVEDRTGIRQMGADHADRPVREGNDVERAGYLQTPDHGSRHLDLRRDDHVDWHAVAGEQILPFRIEVILSSNAGDFRRHVEQGMRHLAGDHVYLVHIGNGDDHLGIGRSCLLQHAGMGRVSDQALDVQRFADSVE